MLLAITLTRPPATDLGYLDVLGRRHDAAADRRGAFPDAVLH
jgi:hypothetical protein